VTLTRSRKFVLTVVLFVLGAALVFVAGAVHGVGPLFAAWIPLLAVPWLLTRPEPGDPAPTSSDEDAEAAAGQPDRLSEPPH
jgi:hypothetical protein